MLAAADFQAERSELGTILASGIFNRAPNLAQLLVYVCSKYFEGESGQLKEYNIAVEALGRPQDFDQKRDSIVRVEAHRLRRRLREYYEREGADHSIQIVIPPGQYAPQFVRRQPAVPVPASEPADLVPAPQSTPASVENATPSLEFAPVRSLRRPILWIVLVFLGLAVVLIGYIRSTKGRKSDVAAVNVSFGLPSQGDQVRILAGSETEDYLDNQGRLWQSDRYFEGGSVFRLSGHRILGTGDPRLYLTRREGTFGYSIPLRPGVYEMRLHFAETLYGETNEAGGGESSRLFNIQVNGTTVVDEFDVVEEVGPNVADILAFKDISPAPDGKLHLRFVPSNNKAFLNAIELIPGVPGHTRPIRLIARDRGFTDKVGRAWDPDRCAKGGQLVSRPELVSGADDPEVYRGERFGNVNYLIPVPPGRYTAIFHFAETWFGPNNPGLGGVGSRVFDILCNGVAIRRDVDIYKEAGGPGRAFTLTFHGLEPNSHGKLAISLTPKKNYAFVNAVEVLEESPAK